MPVFAPSGLEDDRMFVALFLLGRTPDFFDGFNDGFADPVFLAFASLALEAFVFEGLSGGRCVGRLVYFLPGYTANAAKLIAFGFNGLGRRGGPEVGARGPPGIGTRGPGGGGAWAAAGAMAVGKRGC